MDIYVDRDRERVSIRCTIITWWKYCKSKEPTEKVMKLDIAVLVLKTMLEAGLRNSHTMGSDYSSLFYFIHCPPPYSLNETFTVAC